MTMTTQKPKAKAARRMALSAPASTAPASRGPSNTAMQNRGVQGAVKEAAAVRQVIEAGQRASARHWVPATSGNFSVRIDENRIAVTRSGVEKGALTADDILIQPLNAALLPGSSAEAALHTQHYLQHPETRAIFHCHAPHAAVLSRAYAGKGEIRFTGWELQKALAGVASHQSVISLPVFANSQDIASLADLVTQRFDTSFGTSMRKPAAKTAARAANGSSRKGARNTAAKSGSKAAILAPGYLLAGHGLYAWGRDAREAWRHLEALETLLHYTHLQGSYQP